MIGEDDFEKFIQLARSAGRDLTFYDKARNKVPKAELTTVTRSLESYSEEYIEFAYENPTTYHVVEYFCRKLVKNGFTYLSEKTSWDGMKPGKYFTTRGGLNLAAFIITENWDPSQGIGAVGSHIDSLAAKLKPNSTKRKNEGYELVAVAPYSGALSDKWWDRDLAIGGRVIVKSEDGEFVSQLISSSPHPIARISSLAEHFGDAADGPFNQETQMVPIFGFDTGPEPEASEEEKQSNLYGKHSIKILRYIASLAGVSVRQLYQFDLDLFDNQRGTIGGLEDEFMFVPRIDDKLCSFAAIEALIESAPSTPEATFNVVALYDNEEIGSLTRQGAQGKMLESVVEKVTASMHPKGSVRQVFANSLLLSADVTHAFNPNFESQYLKDHRPGLNTGIVCKYYNETKTATDRVGYALTKQIGELNGDEVQMFSARNDVRTGGTIGSMVASSTGARTIDVGIPELSMHSIRGMTGVRDLGLGTKFFKGFFVNWNDVYRSFEPDV